MGLAASQARLLFITARQSDVSMQMQRISNQNMALARDEDDILDTYYKMIDNASNATAYKLADGVSLSYDALMGTTAAASGATSANIITNRDGKVVLTSTAISNYGLDNYPSGEAGDITKIYPTAADFVKQVAGADAAAAVTATSSTTSSTSSTTLNESDKESLTLLKSSYGAYPTTTQMKSVQTLLNSMGSLSSSDLGDCDEWVRNGIINGGSSLSQIASGANADAHIAEDGDTSGVPGEQAAKNVKAIGTAFANKILSALGVATDSGYGIASKLKSYVDQMSQQARNWDASGSETSSESEDLHYIARTAATSTKGSADNDHMYLNLTRMLRTMVNMAVTSLGGDSARDGNMDASGTTISTEMKSLKYNSKGIGVEEYNNYIKQVVGESKLDAAIKYLGGSSNDDDTTTNGTGTATASSLASYYQSIYNALNASGWVTDDNVTSTSVLSAGLENGTYKINGKDNIYESGLYEVDEDAAEEAEEEAEEAADRYKETETRKIKRKEDQLEQQLTQLQTEYSSLTTDYESVKSIISANVQRSFTYCQNG